MKKKEKLHMLRRLEQNNLSTGVLLSVVVARSEDQITEMMQMQEDYLKKLQKT